MSERRIIDPEELAAKIAHAFVEDVPYDAMDSPAFLIGFFTALIKRAGSPMEGSAGDVDNSAEGGEAPESDRQGGDSSPAVTPGASASAGAPGCGDVEAAAREIVDAIKRIRGVRGPWLQSEDAIVAILREHFGGPTSGEGT